MVAKDNSNKSNSLLKKTLAMRVFHLEKTGRLLWIFRMAH
jgi:hypothetical protein